MVSIFNNGGINVLTKKKLGLIIRKGDYDYENQSWKLENADCTREAIYFGSSKP
jgi:hypothetical protein